MLKPYIHFVPSRVRKNDDGDKMLTLSDGDDDGLDSDMELRYGLTASSFIHVGN